MKKIAITGGSGFIGTNLIESLLKDGFDLLNLDISKPVIKNHELLWKKVDILDINLLRDELFKFQPEIIVHLAAVTDLEGDSLDYYKANIEGTQHIITVAAQLPSLQKVIYTSSMYVCKPGIIPADYDTYAPHTVYGESKVKGELLVKAIKTANYDRIIIRPTSIWGPWFKAPYIDFFNIVAQGKYFDFGKACTKTYGYVENTVFQIRKIMDTAGLDKKIFYLGDLPATQISEWANEISIAMGKGPIKKIPFVLLKLAALTGDVLTVLKIKFPISSFRLSNMTTNNILPLDDIFKIAGKPPVNRLDGVKDTLTWMQSSKENFV